jgi:2-polyprenyl-3-methyl-5-hydroxy-6-metoxy-1,4-benzoquinol methylase
MPGQFLHRQLSEYFSKSIESSLQICDYELVRCSKCRLEFAFPYVPASSEFYDWLTLQDNYYPSNRWEWDIVIGLVATCSAGPLRLLEAGCGDGSFLKKVSERWPAATTLGLDASHAAVAHCQSKGVSAVVGDVREFLEENSASRKSFDVALAFHCLEHVADPLEFTRSLCMAVRPGGTVFLSTPYSPMSIEVDWFDALNHPPHHLTRWNESSYRALAAQCGAELVLHSPDATSVWRRAMMSLAAAVWGRSRLFSEQWQRRGVLLHPIQFMRHLLAQAGRNRLNGTFAADVVLAEFRIPK